MARLPALRTHGLRGKALCLNQQFVIRRASRQAFPADHHQHRHGHRADPIKPDMDHSRGRTVQQTTQTSKVGHLRPRICPSRLDQHMIGFILAQDVIDQVGRKRDLPARFAGPWLLPLDQPANHSNFAECAAQQVRILYPVGKLVRQYIG